jgi:hypothetical protein
MRLKKYTRIVLIVMVVCVCLAGVCSARSDVMDQYRAKKGIKEPVPQNKGRVLHFPKDRSLGRIKLIDANTDKYLQIWNDWYWKVEYIADAQGDVIIPAGKKAALFLYKSAFEDLSPLLGLKPDDIFMLSSIGSHDDQPLLSEKCMSYITHLADLKYLWLSGTRGRTKIIAQITKLQSLEMLSPPKGLTNRGLSHISQLNSLKVLSLHDWESRITNAGLTRFLPKLTKLEKLKLYNKHIDDDGLVCLAELPMLSHLNIRYGNFTDAGMAFVKKCSSLRNLDLINLPITDVGVYHLSSLIRLEDLNLYNTEITDRGLAYLKSMPFLKKLDIGKRSNRVNGTPQISDDGMVHIKEIKTLEYLDMYSVDLTDKGLACLGQLPKLKKLGIPTVRYTNPKDYKYWYSDDGLAELAKLPLLEELFIGGTHITGIGIAHLSKLKKLKILQFSDASRLTDSGLAELKALQPLERLTLNCKNITISSLSHLNTLKNISYLEVRGVKQDSSGLDISGLTKLEKLTLTLNVTRKGKKLIYDELRDEDMACLAKLKNLKKLEIYGGEKSATFTDAGIAYLKDLPNMKNLYCRSSHLTDKSLVYLANMKTLNYLTIHGSFTDKGLGHLEELKALRSLTIFSANKFSSAALEQLESKLPNLQTLKVNP